MIKHLTAITSHVQNIHTQPTLRFGKEETEPQTPIDKPVPKNPKRTLWGGLAGLGITILSTNIGWLAGDMLGNGKFDASNPISIMAGTSPKSTPNREKGLVPLLYVLGLGLGLRKGNQVANRIDRKLYKPKND